MSDYFRRRDWNDEQHEILLLEISKRQRERQEGQERRDRKERKWI